MNPQHEIPASVGSIGQVLVLEAERGSARREVLRQWLKDSERPGDTTWYLSADFEEGGVWAGVNSLLRDLMPRLQASHPDFITKHSYELALILPEYRGVIPSRNPLTETAPMQERVRNYPLDRAYRIVHGVINLLDEWHELTGGHWVIACDDYDAAGAMVRRFFTQLMRRRGEKLSLTLLVATSPEAREDVVSQFEPKFLGPVVRLGLPADQDEPVVPEEMTRAAQELEKAVGQDVNAVELHIPQLIRYWALSEHPERSLRWQATALGMYSHQGLYEDALRYSVAVTKELDQLCGDDGRIRWNLVGNLFGCCIAVGNVARAQRLLEEEALAKLPSLNQLVRAYYVMAMLYARFLPELDFQKAAEYLELGLKEIPNTDLPLDEKSFLTSFTLNGLAFVRHRQHKPDEAIRLCRECTQLLDRDLRLDQHRLHRSVLFYNIAQVYAVTGPLQDAIDNYTAAMEMDPNYSEYYNERGSTYLRMGEMEKALQDYLCAVELSPPYPEVFTNLGQCHQLLGRMDEAVEAYSISLDLDPNQNLALVGRAQAYEALGRQEAAIADYTEVLALDQHQPLVLSNRAVLSYEVGRLSDALDDFNRAISLAPETAALRQNRAIVLSDLGRFDEAARDLQTYLSMSPEAEDREEVESRLARLRVSSPVG